MAAVVVAVTEAAVDAEAAWAAEAASMAVDLVVVGASTAAVVASIAVLVSTALLWVEEASAVAASMDVSRAVASTAEDFTEADFTDVRL